jgi:hypothetical protein
MPKHSIVFSEVLFIRPYDDDDGFAVGKTPMEAVPDNGKVVQIGVYRLEKVEKFRKLISVERVEE